MSATLPEMGTTIGAMRFWLMCAFAHLMLIVSILWNVQHVPKVYTYGWFATMGLNDASTSHILATFVALGLVYIVHLMLLVGVGRLWRGWFPGLTSN